MFGGSKKLRHRIDDLLSLLNPRSQPNLHALRQIASSIEPLSFNIKQLGYSLARELAAALPPENGGEAVKIGLQSSLSTQAAIASPWVAYWCGELGIPVVYHRKIWELCFVLQALHEADMIHTGARGLGFGCGAEPIPSYLAAHGVAVTATDLAPDKAAADGWVRTGQHAGAPEQTFMSHLVDRDQFDRKVAMRFVDMNNIPADLAGYDFCWSICALEHLGSIDQGLGFIEHSLGALRPGGVAVHTTEYNIRDDGPTIDNWVQVAFQRKHLEALTDRLEAQGHRVMPFDLSLGDGPLDRFVDLPPFHHDLPTYIGDWLGQPAHLKIAYHGLVLTCVGLIVHKSDQGASAGQ